MSQVAIGVPQYGQKKKNNFRLQDGENIYRILPPLGALAAEGAWAVYECLHWGYKGTKGFRSFRCIQKKDFKTKMIKVQCPECDKVAEVKALHDAHETRLKSEGKTDAQIKEFCKPLADWLYSHNLDKKWYVNALTQDGKIGRLAIPHKMYVQLQEVITDLVSKQGVDPIAADGGVWFNLVRSGKGNQTSHRVAVVTEDMEVEMPGGKKVKVQTNKPAPLTQDVIARLGAEAFDLKNCWKALSYDEIKRLVLSEGDPEIVDSVFMAGEIEQSAPDADEPNPGATATSAVNVATKPVVAPQPPLTTGGPTQEEIKAAMEAKMKALQEEMARMQAQVTVTAPPATTVPASKPSASAASTMTDDDFIKQFGFSTK